MLQKCVLVEALHNKNTFYNFSESKKKKKGWNKNVQLEEKVTEMHHKEKTFHEEMAPQT